MKLPGETPLSAETARRLMEAPGQYVEQRLWELLDGDHPLVLDLAPDQPPVLASILGQGGEVMAVKFSENVLLNVVEHGGGLPATIYMRRDLPAFTRLLAPLGLRLMLVRELEWTDEAYATMTGGLFRQ